MSERPFIVFGSIEDLHVSKVCDQLAAAGVESYFIDLDEEFFWSKWISTNSQGVKVKAIRVDGAYKEVDFTRALVWLRNKNIVHSIKNKHDQHKSYRLSESDDLLKSLLEIHNIKHFNSIYSRFSANRKIIQLQCARKIGLKIPNTLISNDKSDVLDFLNNIPGRAIVKPLHSAVIPPTLDGEDKGSTIFVNWIDAKEIRETDPKSIAVAPAQYQEYIDKAYELRVVVTKLGCASYKIDSQKSIGGKMDWRRAQFEYIFEPARIPDELSEKLVTFVNKLGLVYGVMDIIHAENGEYYFLECNIDGQWAWLEFKSDDAPITALMTQTILKELEE